MILHQDIRQDGDPILRQRSQVFDFDTDNIDDLLQKMRFVLDAISKKYDFSWAMGISAVQLGTLKRVCLVWMPETGFFEVINPEILQQSDSNSLSWEGCLSFFDKRGAVARPDWIDLVYYDRDQNKIEKRFEGNAVRILCHEIDHMDGVLYKDKMLDDHDLLDFDVYKELKASNDLPV